MRLQSLLCVSTFALVTAISSSHETRKANGNEEIFKFYSTKELIWTTHTTGEVRRLCKVDLKETLISKSIAFRRSFYEDRRWVMREYSGTFRKSGTFNRTAREPYDTLDVKRNIDGNMRHIVTETLHYQSKDNRCAVFLILGTHGTSVKLRYELRMRDSKIKEGFNYQDPCWKALNDAKHKKILKLYDKKCQNALHKLYPNPLQP
uniref:Putative group i salivary lipocalin n=1 Tax=Rhipicephalus pulchellus TaxID=72859 RepID=L7LRE0_RHIPC